MNAHIGYLAYVLRHKWHVLYAGLFLGVPVWRLVIHDFSKFTPAEWGPYVRRFYGPKAKLRGDDLAFDAAWHHHWTHNPHHWDYWTLPNYGRAGSPDDWHQTEAGTLVQPMPETYVREMVADWYGAGMAQRKPAIEAWYQANVGRMQLHPDTKALVHRFITEAVLKGVFRG